jgi:hypothetical protein
MLSVHQRTALVCAVMFSVFSLYVEMLYLCSPPNFKFLMDVIEVFSVLPAISVVTFLEYAYYNISWVAPTGVLIAIFTLQWRKK